MYNTRGIAYLHPEMDYAVSELPNRGTRKPSPQRSRYSPEIDHFAEAFRLPIVSKIV